MTEQELIQKVPAAQEEIVAPAVDEKKLDAEIKEHKHPEVNNKTEEKSKKVEEKIKEEKVAKKVEISKKATKNEAPRKNEAFVKGLNLHISTKHSMALCKFVKNKTAEQAIKDLEKVLKFKKPVPMKGEIPHRKGKIMSGRYPINATKDFIKLIKTLEANARVNGLKENSRITEASASIASLPYGRFGKHRKKRTYVILKMKNKENNKPLKKDSKINGEKK